MHRDIESEFTTEVHRLVGLPCWSYIAGKGTGSHVSLDFGKKISLSPPVRNERLTDDQRAYHGEKRLFITCLWRLDSPTEVVCGASDSNEDGGPMLLSLDQIVGRNIIDARASAPAWDLTLDFGGLILSVFS